jgi:hypothetical protein
MTDQAGRSQGIPDIAKVFALPGPMEYLQPSPGGTVEFTVLKFQVGKATIRPIGQPQKEVVVLRVWVPQGDKSLYPDYWDVNQQTLIPQLLPWLQAAGGRPLRFRIMRFGTGPSSRFSVVQIPIPGK